MSVEITLYTKIASKTSLTRALVNLNFKKVKHFLEEMNTVDQIHYMWYGFDDYQSLSGVEATIMMASPEEKLRYKCSDWILTTRTRSSGSYEDKQTQNEVIRGMRKQFGGSFYNDWYGTNKYIDLKDYDKYTPLEKGLSIVASNSLEKLDLIKNSLMSYKNEMSESIAEHPEFIKKLFVTKDPSIVLYNSLMPFLVSVLEYFYGQSFVHFLKYNDNAKLLLLDEKTKIGIPEIINILKKENSLEQVIMESYNFQNLESINKAYRKYLSIDILSILSKKKKINHRVFRISTKLQEILEARHKFVHELDINYNLTKQDYFDYVTTMENVIKLTLKSFEEKKLKVVISN